MKTKCLLIIILSLILLIVFGCESDDSAKNDTTTDTEVAITEEEYLTLKEKITDLEQENEQLKEELELSSDIGEEINEETVSDTETVVADYYDKPEDMPVRITKIEIEPPGYIFGELTVVFENVGEDSIDEIHVVALLFDEQGYPISGRDGEVNAKMTNNLHPGEAVGGQSYYHVDGEARKAKIEIEKIVFFDKDNWTNPGIQKWINEEKNRY